MIDLSLRILEIKKKNILFWGIFIYIHVVKLKNDIYAMSYCLIEVFLCIRFVLIISCSIHIYLFPAKPNPLFQLPVVQVLVQIWELTYS